MLKAFDLNADLPSLAILHKKASHPGGFFVSGVRVDQLTGHRKSSCSYVFLGADKRSLIGVRRPAATP